MKPPQLSCTVHSPPQNAAVARCQHNTSAVIAGHESWGLQEGDWQVVAPPAKHGQLSVELGWKCSYM